MRGGIFVGDYSALPQFVNSLTSRSRTDSIRKNGKGSANQKKIRYIFFTEMNNIKKMAESVIDSVFFYF